MTPSPPVLKTPNSSNSQLVSVTLDCRTRKRHTSSDCETMHGRETCIIYMNVMRVAKQSVEGTGDRERGPEASGKGGRFWT